MTSSQELIEANSTLRRRLIFGSVSLAVAVSIIFIVVAYRLAGDLGESIELESSNKLANHVASSLEALVNQEENTPLPKTAIENTLKFLFLDSDIVCLEVWHNGQHYHLIEHPNNLHIDPLYAAIKVRESSAGLADTNDGRFFWRYHQDDRNRISFIIVTRVSALDTALAYVANRLTITAFLTFWLAVWAALIMSALIAKRFEANSEKLAYLATHDTLTGLPNRSYLIAKLSQRLIHHSDDKTDLHGAVLLVDLNKFKDVNDSMGHAAGDELLVSLSARLSELIGDNGEIVRYGGDEFVIWIDSIDEQKAIYFAEQYAQACSDPILVKSRHFEIGASIGIACYPRDGQNVDDLFKHADIAMYQAKRLRMGVQVYRAEQHTLSNLRIRLRGQLNSALEQGQFILNYQPKVQLPDGKIIGVEALVRWQHPNEGLLAPGMFIDLIEQSGIVHAFSRYVITESIAQCRHWINEGVYLATAVNLSPYNLMDDTLIPHIKSKLAHYRVPPELLEIELTESGAMMDLTSAQTSFSELRKIGVKLSIDDFGTGMSSLAYIKELDVDYVKIDRSFIVNIVEDHRDEAIVKGLMGLCSNLHKTVIAEGVETAEQADKLYALGCTLAQGYYFGKPLDASSIVKLLKA